MKELYYGKVLLGVPIQKRPPGKYASHPYPILITDRAMFNAEIKGAGLLMPIFKDVAYIGANISGEGELRALLKSYSFDTEQIALSTRMFGDGEIVDYTPKEYLVKMDINQVRLSTSMRGNGEIKRILIKHQLQTNKAILSTSMRGNGVIT